MLVDTNVLLRIAEFEGSQDEALLDRIDLFWSRNAILCITLQNLAEFWNVATRQLRNNGFGRTVADVAIQADILATQFRVLPESEDTVVHWRRLVEDFSISGVMVHDARLAAIMQQYRINTILTLNQKDFARFPFIEAINPLESQG